MHYDLSHVVKYENRLKDKNTDKLVTYKRERVANSSFEKALVEGLSRLNIAFARAVSSA